MKGCRKGKKGKEGDEGRWENISEVLKRGMKRRASASAQRFSSVARANVPALSGRQQSRAFPVRVFSRLVWHKSIVPPAQLR